MLFLDGAPDLEPLLAGRERTAPLLVGLRLIEGRPDGGALVCRIPQFDHRQWQAVDENRDVGTAVVLSFNEGELIHSQPVVVSGLRPSLIGPLSVDPHPCGGFSPSGISF